MGWEDDWQRGDILGDYELIAKLGEGGMSRVYEARHVALGTRVAIKTLRPERRHEAAVLARFVREGRAMARLHHPHVAKVITVGVHRESPFLVMEFLAGNDLLRHIEGRGPMDVPEVLAVMLPVLSAVQAAHDLGMIHRDLKPGNIMLEEGHGWRARPVVVDFGIARLDDNPVDHLRTNGSAILGTPAYMAPEQVRGARGVTAQTDQYALAVILYECLTGAAPFAGELFELLTRVARGQCVPLHARRPELPEGLARAVERAMAVDPRARFHSVREFALALLPFADAVSRPQWASRFDPTRPHVPSDDATTRVQDATIVERDATTLVQDATVVERDATTLVDVTRAMTRGAPQARPKRAAVIGALVATALALTAAAALKSERAPPPRVATAAIAPFAPVVRTAPLERLDQVLLPTPSTPDAGALPALLSRSSPVEANALRAPLRRSPEHDRRPHASGLLAPAVSPPEAPAPPPPPPTGSCVGPHGTNLCL